MKERKIMVTIEALSNIPLKLFNKKEIQRMFDGHSLIVDLEIFTVHQVKVQAVKENK